jgi:hypothetical protein
LHLVLQIRALKTGRLGDSSMRRVPNQNTEFPI